MNAIIKRWIFRRNPGDKMLLQLFMNYLMQTNKALGFQSATIFVNWNEKETNLLNHRYIELTYYYEQFAYR